MRHIIFFALFLCTFNFSYSQNWEQKLDSVLNIIAEDKAFHGQVLIAEKGKIVFHKSYGKIPDTEETISLNTPLAVKSITKAFTAAAVLKLEQEGKINLNDKLKNYFPNWPYEQITIKQLLSMTSGLPSFIEKAVNKADTTKYMTNLDIVKFISQNPVQVNPPGKTYNYQNSNYITLAALVEKVSGISYEQYVSNTIFKPLKLKNTYFEIPSQSTNKINGDTFYAPSGDGNLYATAEDLYRFEQSFYGNKILTDNNKIATFSKTTLTDGSQSKYGLGWWIVDNAQQKELYIIGDGPNKRASIQRYPESNTTFIFIHNISGRYWKEVYWVIYNIWKGNDFTMPQKKEALATYNIDISSYEKYVGRYVLQGFGLLHITTENGKLYLRPDPIPGKEELIPASDTTFYFKDQSMEWEFFLDSQGNVLGFGSKGKPEMMGKKQKP